MKLTLYVMVAMAACSAFAESMFDGKSLDNWVGNPEYWTVKDGAITGSSETQIPKTQYIYWKGAPVGDFELRVKYRMVGGNSGVQYRSRVSDEKAWQVVGYQADIDASGKYTGILYEQGGRGICAKRGQKVTLKPGGKKGKKEVTGSLGDPTALFAGVKLEKWNEYVITAKGNVLTHVINGTTMVEVFDEDPKLRAMSGILALQIHKGGPMIVQFKDFKLTRFGDTKKD